MSVYYTHVGRKGLKKVAAVSRTGMNTALMGSNQPGREVGREVKEKAAEEGRGRQFAHRFEF
jgi:hypothetical protein